MLTRFKVSGYRNFITEIDFDLTHTGRYDFNRNLIKDGIINKGLIYGKNGSGKSNLGRAIFDIEKNLMLNNQQNLFAYDVNPTYRCLDSKEDVFFSYSFQFGKDHLVYEYTKKDPFHVTTEKVTVNNEVMLSFKGDKENIICRFPGIDKVSFTSLADGVSPLLFIYRTFRFSDDSPVRKLFSFVEGMLWFRCLNLGNEFEGKGSSENLEQRIIQEEKLDDFQKFLEKAGLSYRLSLETGINPTNGKPIQTIYADFKEGKTPLNVILSTGTMALELFYYWFLQFKDRSFVFIDEFDAFYHYELSASIVKLLNQETEFQSFVTTHNTTLMNNELMRPDCLFLIANNKIKNLQDATEKDLREGHNLEKIYRNDGFHVE